MVQICQIKAVGKMFAPARGKVIDRDHAITPFEQHLDIV
jgi:hypothetical protein